MQPSDMRKHLHSFLCVIHLQTHQEDSVFQKQGERTLRKRAIASSYGLSYRNFIRKPSKCWDFTRGSVNTSYSYSEHELCFLNHETGRAMLDFLNAIRFIRRVLPALRPSLLIHQCGQTKKVNDNRYGNHKESGLGNYPRDTEAHSHVPCGLSISEMSLSKILSKFTPFLQRRW